MHAYALLFSNSLDSSSHYRLKYSIYNTVFLVGPLELFGSIA